MNERINFSHIAKIFVVQIVLGMGSLAWAFGLATFLKNNQSPWSEIPLSVFILLTLAPLLFSNIFYFYKSSILDAPIRWLWKTAISIYTLALGAVIFLLVGFGVAMDDCPDYLGRGSAHGQSVVIYSCESLFHSLEHWVGIFPESIESRKDNVGYADVPPLITVGAVDLYPSKLNKYVFSSPPLSAEIVGKSLKVKFKDGASKNWSIPNP